MKIPKKEKKQLIQAKTPESIVKAIDSIAEKEGVSRASVVIFALENLVRDYTKPKSGV